MAYIAKTNWTAADGIGAVDVNKWEQGIADAHAVTDTYTPADVLAKLLTVDGAGSGLDADTVKGYIPVNKAGDTMSGPLGFPGTTGDKVRLYSTTYGLAVNPSELTLYHPSSAKAVLRDGPAGAVIGELWHAGNTPRTRINAGVFEFLDGSTWKVAGGVKNVQRGLASIASGATEVNITIAAVNLSKAYVNPLTVPTGYTIDARLTSTTNLYIRVRAVSGGFADISWEVVEFY